MFLINAAYAQAAGGVAAGQFEYGQFLLPLLLLVVFYFFLIRPQQRKLKEHRAMVQALRRGDRVVTNGGLVGVVTKLVGEGEVQLEIAEGVRVRLVRSAVSEVLNKGTATDGDKPASEKEPG